MTKAIIDQLLVPFIASNISLLFALMSRNATISQRIREACRELWSEACFLERGACLSWQIEKFKRRYASNKLAIVFVLVAVASFVVAVIFASVMKAFAWISVGAFFLTVLLTLWDFIRATETLNSEIDFAHEWHNRRMNKAEPKTNA